MWISRQIIKPEQQPAVQNAKVTMNAEGEIEAVYSGVERALTIYSPYGYTYSVPRGEELLIAKSDGSQSALGVEMHASGIAQGEILIQSKSGASIYLKKNGSGVINGLIINKRGEIENG